ncbi:prepilin peptidase [Oceanospirillum multiglobuliferum]|uniref:Prepilin leader peptidase/N-methyltransferase n=1 Tax=Oceanospirillum multiglobuliferum TaxID=64969 RepID=A0A1V4T8A0_9GAMM|nr:prepilin peptidase [Oceanospirillum multiglobuliferum]
MAQLLDNPLLLSGIIFFAGLLLGSFLNVVIYRLPLMLERQWQQECANYQADLAIDQSKHNIFNLAWPASHCPNCHHSVAAYDNIPLLSYLLLKGRCRHCHQNIARQYPAVELASGLLALASLYVIGIQLQALLLYVVSLVLLALLVIDLKTQLLPDLLTQPLLWAGLLTQQLFYPEQLDSALWGAVLGYLVLWSIYWLFKLATGKEGMGYGDFKLLAALGAWGGAAALPAILLISALTGLLIALLLRTTGQLASGQAMPFGPALALAGWLVLYFPTQIQSLMWTIF